MYTCCVQHMQHTVCSIYHMIAVETIIFTIGYKICKVPHCQYELGFSSRLTNICIKWNSCNDRFPAFDRNWNLSLEQGFVVCRCRCSNRNYEARMMKQNAAVAFLGTCKPSRSDQARALGEMVDRCQNIAVEWLQVSIGFVKHCHQIVKPPCRWRCQDDGLHQQVAHSLMQIFMLDKKLNKKRYGGQARRGLTKAQRPSKTRQG